MCGHVPVFSVCVRVQKQTEAVITCGQGAPHVTCLVSQSRGVAIRITPNWQKSARAINTRVREKESDVKNEMRKREEVIKPF